MPVEDVSVPETERPEMMMVQVVWFWRREENLVGARGTGPEEVQTLWVGCECETVSSSAG